MSTPTQPQTGADVMAQFIPSSPFVAKLGIELYSQHHIGEIEESQD